MSTSPEPSVPKNSNLTRSTLQFPVVGIGASAGGLKALITLFESMPADCGMAFVVIMHLAQTREQGRPDPAEGDPHAGAAGHPADAHRAQPHLRDPPALDLSMNDGYLRLTEPQRERGVQVAIELFFRTLADTHHTTPSASCFPAAVPTVRWGCRASRNRAASPWRRNPAMRSSSRCRAAPSKPAWSTSFCRWPTSRRSWSNCTATCRRCSSSSARCRRPRTASTPRSSRARWTTSRRNPRPSLTSWRCARSSPRCAPATISAITSWRTVLRRIERRMQVNALPDMPSYARYLQGNRRKPRHCWPTC